MGGLIYSVQCEFLIFDYDSSFFLSFFYFFYFLVLVFIIIIM